MFAKRNDFYKSSCYVINNKITFNKYECPEPGAALGMILQRGLFLQKFSSWKYLVGENFRLIINFDENFGRRIFSHLR